MATFDRFDICEAYHLAEMLWNRSGWLQERPSNQRRREACSIQLARMQFKPSPLLSGPEDLTDNGREIYADLLHRLGLARAYCRAEGCWEPVPFDQGSDYCAECIMADREPTEPVQPWLGHDL